MSLPTPFVLFVVKIRKFRGESQRTGIQASAALGCALSMQISQLSQDPVSAAIVLGVLLLLASWIGWLRGRGSAFPYEPAPALLTPAERSFFEILKLAVGEDFALFSKVRLADVIVVRPGVPPKQRLGAFSRISSKHLDFVVCNPETYEILGVIELDDRSHRESSRVRRDAFLDSALSAAQIPILHVPAQRQYSATKLRSQTLAFLECPGPTLAERHS